MITRGNKSKIKIKLAAAVCSQLVLFVLSDKEQQVGGGPRVPLWHEEENPPTVTPGNYMQI